MNYYNSLHTHFRSLTVQNAVETTKGLELLDNILLITLIPTHGLI